MARGMSVPNKCQGGAIWQEGCWCLTSAREVPYIFGADKVSKSCLSRNDNLVPNKCLGGVGILVPTVWIWHRLSNCHNSPHMEEFPSNGLYIAQGHIQLTSCFPSQGSMDVNCLT